MTFLVVIECDRRPCRENYQACDVDTADAQRLAERVGWFCSAAADYCPEHRRLTLRSQVAR